MLPSARRCLLLLCLAVLAALGSVPSASAASKKVKISANFVYVTGECTWGIGIRFPLMRGAESYLVEYYDGYWKRLITTSLTPDKTNGDPSAPKGTGFAGITGGSHSPPCNDEPGDPSGGGRFSRGAKAWALFKKPVYKVSGTVRRSCLGGCSLHRELAGVTISAKRKGGGSASAVTGSDGKYQLAIPRKGDWTFTPSGPKLRFKPRFRKYTISADKSGVDFSGCGGSAATAAFTAPARAAALTPGNYHNKLHPAPGTGTDCSSNVFFVQVKPDLLTVDWTITPNGKPVFSYDFELKNPGPGTFPLKSRRGSATVNLVITDPPTAFSVQSADATRRYGGNTETVNVSGPVALSD
jgi:hypothetical protein